MHYYKKHTAPKKDYLGTITKCLLLAFLISSLFLGYRHEADMSKYAANNKCQWVYNGTYYWNEKDYTCK